MSRFRIFTDTKLVKRGQYAKYRCKLCQHIGAQSINEVVNTIGDTSDVYYGHYPPSSISHDTFNVNRLVLQSTNTTIYIDYSEKQTLDSIYNSDLKFELPYTFIMPPNSRFYLTVARKPHMWEAPLMQASTTIYSLASEVKIP